MGYMVHHAVVVTAWNRETAEAAQGKARECFAQVQETFGNFDGSALVGELIPAAVNGYWTFLVGPDGSKAGWSTDEQGDDARDDFIDWLKAQDWRVVWAEVKYGDEEGDDTLLRHSRPETDAS